MNDFRTYNWRGRPVLAVGKTPRRLRRAAARHYPAHTWRRKAFKSVLRLSVFLGADGKLGSDTPMPRLSGIDLHDCLDRITRLLETDRANAVFTFPSQDDRGRLYVTLFNEDCALIGFAKIASPDGEPGLLEAEAKTLTEVAALPGRSYLVPSLIALESVGSCHVLLSEPLPAAAQPYPCDDRAAPAFRVSPSRQRIEPRAFESLSWWPALQTELTQDYAAFAKALERYREHGLNVGRSHGDLTSANIVSVDRDVWIYDWEQSQPDAPDSTDAIGYFLGCRSRQAAAAPQQVMEDVRQRFFLDRSDVEQADAAFSLAYRLSYRCDDARGILKYWEPIAT